MRVIGIDPGTVCCGYGIVEAGSKKLEVRGKNPNFSFPASDFSLLTYIASGEIRMEKRDALPDRLKVLHDSLSAIISEYKPTHLCIEKIFYHKSINSAFALGSTRGIVMLLAADNSLPVFEYNSTQLKMALTGYGRAEKRQVKDMVIRILNLNSSALNLSEDTTDALALCICHINSANRLQ